MAIDQERQAFLRALATCISKAPAPARRELFDAYCGCKKGPEPSFTLRDITGMVEDGLVEEFLTEAMQHDDTEA